MAIGHDGYGSLASALVLAIVCYVLSIDFASVVPLAPANSARFAILAILALGWVLVARRLAVLTPDEKTKQKGRVQQAIAAGTGTGVTEDWYRETDSVMQAVSSFFGTAFALGVVLVVAKSFPSAATAVIAGDVHRAWAHLLETYTHKQLYIGGIFACFVVPFYTVCLAFAALDFARPKWLEPFKIQEKYRLTWPQFLKCFSLVLLNQAVMFALLYLTWDVYPIFAPDGFSDELPGLFTTAVHLLCYLPISDIFFYFPHAYMHKNAWVYENIHSIHHSWKAPIALSAIYSHPVEFLVGNVPTVAAGPLLLGSHITTFWLWAFAAVVGTCLNHCGYQLPFLPGNQIHDYHHSTFVPADGPQNLGVLGCLDHLCGTDKGFLASWQVKLHQRYTTPDYPVDKILESTSKKSATNLV